ncbi:L-2-hydroxyglutarate oxidase [Dactylosporangium matsuzakiense]|uniref:Hydroxyglutarate oxidase n=1 Tax=Dactylosporangium matsuzakiense TaxID=53360 RepID=A0A9W6NRM7_9ACTN|nr:L-2-hydroxyglutarate oxidase [Dactylosporangium matsuzakiense]UWZ46456.1 L-2-hydroxyglutarate oxidase [Dactylosporangium matsuzakiense]GLL06583.1 hydroxyglutarate oxidase [Dactylosporangium matsuzakiense]
MRYVVIGGGIVGLAVAHRLVQDRPDARVTVVEKESGWGAHQTGHNSGVIHAGVYYKPGSLKATLCKAGSASLVEFCDKHGIAHKVTGKLIVATDASERPRLHALFERSVANGLPVRKVSQAEAREYEPHVACVEGIHVASTGIVDYKAVCAKLAELAADAGAVMRLNTAVTGIRAGAREVVVRTTTGDITADVLVNCAGLHADRVARLAGIQPPARIIPFRGEYYELRPDRRHLVNGLIYPVPDPQFPFLGVHLTKMIDGSVHAGPNAVLALAREGYSWGRIRPRDVAEVAAYSGLWQLARKHLRYGVTEVRRSLSKRRFAESLARLVPEVTAADLVPAEAGVRAQAITPAGDLVDDFLIVTEGPQVHVLNAPSPAATSSLEIAKYITARLPL